MWKHYYGSIWNFKRQSGFVNRYLLDSFTEKMFKKRTCISYAIFKLIRNKLCLCFKKQHTRLTKSIYVENMIAMSLNRLGKENGLHMVGKI